jgi:hypothetical protein
LIRTYWLHAVSSMQSQSCADRARKNLRIHLKTTLRGCLCLLSLATVQLPAWGWGEVGHVLSGKAAAVSMPVAMPEFFRNATDQLGYLTAEPDRWRDHTSAAVTNAFNPDHAINLELVPPGGLEARDRFVYLAMLEKAGETSAVGMAPFRTLEMYQRLRIEFRLWRKTTDPQTRGWIEQRIINDAGLLGHYVTSIIMAGWGPTRTVTQPITRSTLDSKANTWKPTLCSRILRPKSAVHPTS